MAVSRLGALQEDPVPLLGSRHELSQERQSVRAGKQPGIQYCYWDLAMSSHRSDRVFTSLWNVNQLGALPFVQSLWNLNQLSAHPFFSVPLGRELA